MTHLNRVVFVLVAVAAFISSVNLLRRSTERWIKVAAGLAIAVGIVALVEALH